MSISAANRAAHAVLLIALRVMIANENGMFISRTILEEGAVPLPAATFLGLTAILLWGTTIAFSRGMAERLGTFTGAALAYGDRRQRGLRRIGGAGPPDFVDI